MTQLLCSIVAVAFLSIGLPYDTFSGQSLPGPGSSEQGDVTEPHDLLLSWAIPDPVKHLSRDLSGNILVTGRDVRVFTHRGVEVRRLPILGSLVCSPVEAVAGPAGSIFVSDAIFAPEEECTVYLHRFDASGGYMGGENIPDGFGRVGAMASTPQGVLFVASYSPANLIARIDPDGTVGATWEVPDAEENNGIKLMAVGPGDRLHVAMRREPWILVYDAEGNEIERFGQTGFGTGLINNVAGLAVDDSGQIHVAQWHHRIQRYSPDGVFLDEWHPGVRPEALAVDSQGYLYVASVDRVFKYDNRPRIPPPLIPRHQPVVMLHVDPAGTAKNACASPLEDPYNTVTSGADDPYFVYVLVSASPAGAQGAEGVLGVQFGITYQSASPGGLAIHSWTDCGTQQIPDPSWPAPGAGNQVLWPQEPTLCQRRAVVSAGYFYVTAYAPTVMSVGRHPGMETATVIACDYRDDPLYSTLPAKDLGWVSLNGGVLGQSDEGCNPLFRPCEDATAVEEATWGGIKRMFRQDSAAPAGKPAP